MRRSITQLGSVWLLLLVLALSTGAAWKVGERHACACGMTVGCCCERGAAVGMKAHAMKPGASCNLRRPGRGCSFRQGEGPALRSRVDSSLARSGAGLESCRLLPPSSPGAALRPSNRSAPSTPAREPLSPPPRLV